MKTPPKPPGGLSLVFRGIFLFSTLGLFLAAGVLALVFWRFSSGLPKIVTAADYRPLTVTRVLGRGGQEDSEIGEFYKERRYVIPYEKIPDVVVKAFISAEDDRFFEHPGFNISSIIRASIANFKAGHVVQGGSTITQQVAKSMLLTSEKSFVRKIKEVILSARMEKNLTKQQILFLYLNQIYLGHGAYGIESATRTYFNHDVSQVTLAEAALLAGMPQAPGKYSPLLNPKKAKERQLYVLKRMLENKYITQAQYAAATTQPLRVFHDEDINSKYAAYLVEYIRRYLVDKYGEDAVYEDGLTVSVPADPRTTVAASRQMKEGLRAVDKRQGYRGAIQQLKSDEEIEKFLKEQRVKIIEDQLHYQVLNPDGTLDAVAAMNQAGIADDSGLLKEGETYRGVVTAIDEKKKMAHLLIGAAKAELPAELMSWARSGKGTLGSVLHRGDVVLVEIQAHIPGAVKVSLEQEPQVQGALLSLESQTGNVLAMEGGYDYEASEFNRAVQAQRQPGSSFKPIIYAAALEHGYTPASILVDSPIVYEDSESGKWKPSNFEEKFYGDTTFRQALIKSRNVPTIKIVQQLQVQNVIDYAKRLGIDGKFNADLSISLGSASISLFEMTKAYALFPRLGRKVTPIFISKVVDRDGKTLEENKPIPLPTAVAAAPSAQPSEAPAAAASPTPPTFAVLPRPEDPDQVLDPRVAYVMTHLMKEVVAYGTGHEATNLGRPAAGKTGTTNEYNDAWFMGFTPNVVTGVWVGYDNQKTIGHLETGARAALPIWLGFMKEAVKNYPDSDFTIPKGVVFATIDPASGKLAAANSSTSIQEAFIEGTQPTEMADPNRSAPSSRGDFFKEDTE
jgi:penicillin-binding protein 1A